MKTLARPVPVVTLAVSTSIHLPQVNRHQIEPRWCENVMVKAHVSLGAEHACHIITIRRWPGEHECHIITNCRWTRVFISVTSSLSTGDITHYFVSKIFHPWVIGSRITTNQRIWLHRPAVRPLFDHGRWSSRHLVQVTSQVKPGSSSELLVF